MMQLGAFQNHQVHGDTPRRVEHDHATQEEKDQLAWSAVPYLLQRWLLFTADQTDNEPDGATTTAGHVVCQLSLIHI